MIVGERDSHVDTRSASRCQNVEGFPWSGRTTADSSVDTFLLLPFLRAPLEREAGWQSRTPKQGRERATGSGGEAVHQSRGVPRRRPVCFRSRARKRTTERRMRSDGNGARALPRVGASIRTNTRHRRCVSRRFLQVTVIGVAAWRRAASRTTDWLTAGRSLVPPSRRLSRGIVARAIAAASEAGKPFSSFPSTVSSSPFSRTSPGSPDLAGPTTGALGTRPESPPLPSSRLTITRRPFRRRRRCCRQTEKEEDSAVESAVWTYYRLTPPRQLRNELARHEGSKAPRQNNNRTQPPTSLSPTTARELGGRCRRCRCRCRRCPVAVTRARRPSSLYFLSTTARDQPWPATTAASCEERRDALTRRDNAAVDETAR